MFAFQYNIPDGRHPNEAGGLNPYFKLSQGQGGNKKVSWEGRGSSSQEVGSSMSSSSSNFAPLTQGMDLDESADLNTGRQSFISSAGSHGRRRQRSSQNDGFQGLSSQVPGTQCSRNSGAERETRQRKKRKLSNVARPIDICDPMDEDSSY